MSDDAEITIPGPRETAALLGQESAETELFTAANSGRLPHAWLLKGRRGIGKATLAYRFARYMFAGGATNGAQDGLFGEPEGLSSLYVHPDTTVFRQVAGQGHANMRLLESSPDSKKHEIKVDRVRKLIGFFRATAWEDGWRIAIIDPAEELNESATNALLKILEEPPEKSLFLLVSHAPARLLPTIRSRCRQLALRPLEPGVLQTILTELRPDLATEQVAAVVPLADGSVSRALALLDAGGIQLFEAMSELLDGLPELDIDKLHAFAEKAAKRDDNSDRFVIATELLDWTLATAIRDAAGHEGTAPGQAEMSAPAALEASIGSTGALERWAELWENTVRQMRSADSASLDRKQVLLETFFKIQAVARS